MSAPVTAFDPLAAVPSFLRNLIGKRVGKINVVGFLGLDVRNASEGVWLCQCDCGEAMALTSAMLYDTKHCGGYRETEARQCPDLTGRVFGAYTVLNKSSKKPPTWLCQCQCGETRKIQEWRLLSPSTHISQHCLHRSHPPLPPGEGGFNALIGRYRRHGQTWTLSRNEARALFEGNCFYCGCPPQQVTQGKSARGAFTYNGIDRVNSHLGYIGGNVVSCCKRCNFAKNVASTANFKQWIVRVYKHMEAHNV